MIKALWPFSSAKASSAPGGSKPASSRPSGRPSGRRNSLGLKLLLVTLASVMGIEILILAQSVSNEQRRYLQKDVDTAYLVMLALSDEPSVMLKDQLLQGLDAWQIRASIPGRMTMALELPEIDGNRQYKDLRALYPMEGGFAGMTSAWSTLFEAQPKRDIAIVSAPSKDENVGIQILKSGSDLVAHLRGYSQRILLLSLIIALGVGMLVYLALYWIIVVPVGRLAKQMDAFAHAPERYHAPIDSKRQDEIGVVEQSFDAMRGTVQSAFRQKSRLATLGTAVAKINHDLKNVLSTALLLSDSLEASSDPMVARIAPRLVGSIEKATTVCEGSLRFTIDGTESVKPELLCLDELSTEVWNSVGGPDKVAMAKSGLSTEKVTTDRLSLFRVLSNLAHNAVQAGADSLSIDCDLQDDHIKLRLTDNGPGLPKRVQDHLFEPFVTVGKKKGTGLGLAISRELTEALGGNLALLETSEAGTTFEMRLPKHLQV